MSSVSGVTGYSPAAAGTADQGNRQELGTDTFFQLLVTQLRYQDPLSGEQSTGEFITQMTLFTLVEQVIRLQQSVEQQNLISQSVRALNLLNRTVEVTDLDDAVYRGEVESVRFVTGHPYLSINGREFPLHSVIKVEERS